MKFIPQNSEFANQLRFSDERLISKIVKMVDKIMDKEEGEPTVDMSILTVESAIDSTIQVINFNGK